ncbi:DUF2933 domain-containing protein [Stenotrophomonas maltophilia]|uniref:DUF2933 domain-containing protein n=1 Tax=Stenotrophomonas sp. Ste96 TaxID=2926029 RepID=UPI000C1497D4|nr:DUF2933 domain-containing protein [Stenotrophomonas sp. Ste96]MBA0380562.1 DUF2933 domain-containing protein [Stenotrophomonas maltophilia]MBA0409422.1 DUF2933 domain-containing protein [Stenotrophomonas maltophilia]MBA0426732.1 DUF2933 domain-containing protein [Stenotrophomonas maltophilia]
MTAPRSPATSGSRRWVFWIFLALALFYLGVEHRAHLAGTLRWLPLAILLLCPLMHVFMHKGHGGHGGHGGNGRDGDADDTPSGHHDSRRKQELKDDTSNTSSRGH